ELSVVDRGRRPHFCVRKSFWLRISVRVENRFGHHLITRPESKAAHLVRVRFTRNGVGQMWHASGMFRGAPPRESSHSEIEAPPEKVDGAAFAAKVCSKFLEDAIALQKNAPKPVRIFWVVGGILLILFE